MSRPKMIGAHVPAKRRRKNGRAVISANEAREAFLHFTAKKDRTHLLTRHHFETP